MTLDVDPRRQYRRGPLNHARNKYVEIFVKVVEGIPRPTKMTTAMSPIAGLFLERRAAVGFRYFPSYSAQIKI